MIESAAPSAESAAVSVARRAPAVAPGDDSRFRDRPAVPTATADGPDPLDLAQSPWQFSVRSMFIVVAVCCVCLAVASQAEARWSMAIGWLALLVGAHAFANAWGHRTKGARPLDAASALPFPSTPIAWDALPPATRLRRRTSLGPSLPRVTLATAMAGGVLGVALLRMGKLGETGWEGIALGGVSASVLGGFFGFLAGSFLQTAGAALREAGLGSSGKLGRPSAASMSSLERIAETE